MTGNKSYLTDYQDIDGGFVAFVESLKGGKITGKGKIRTGKLDFDDVYFIKELKFNLFSVSQMCDKKNNVLFTETECLILSPDFKLLDESQVLLKVHRQNNMYNFDIKNVVPLGDLTCIENQINHEVKIIRCDNGTEFKNNDMNQFCEMKGIMREFSVARTLQQNGVAERNNMSLIKETRTMLADSLLPTTFWAEAVNTDCYVQNRVLVTKPHNKTPYELLLGKPPSISFMRPFGCPAFRVFNTRTRKVEENLHINFLENKPNVARSGPEWLFDIDSLTKSMNYKPVTVGNQTNGDACIKTNVNAGQARQEKAYDHEYILLPLMLSNSPLSSKRIDSSAKDVNTAGPSINTAIKNINTGSPNISTASPIPNDSSMQSLENTGIFDDAYDDREVGAEADLNNLETTMNIKPKKTLVNLPKCKRAIGTKWVYRNKKDERGIVVRNKARLVTQGYTQEEGINYDEVFALVPRIEAIRLFFTYASFMGLIVYQMDVKSAFLYGTLEEEVYVCQPPGFEDPQFPDKVYKVEKALYGLPQALRVWYETLSTYLLENRYRRGTIDKTLFIKKDKGYDAQEIPDEFYEGKSVNDTLTAELERYKEQVKSVEIDSSKRTLSESFKKKRNLYCKGFTLLKNDFKKEESRNLDREIALESLSKQPRKYRLKSDQSNTNCSPSLTKPQFSYDNTTKQALGFQNPFYLKKARQLEPMLYVGDIIPKTNPIVIPDSEETLTLAEENTRSLIETTNVEVPTELPKIKQVPRESMCHKEVNKMRINLLSGNIDKDKIKQDLEEIETINIELDHRVTKLIPENEHLKKTYNQLYDSIKPAREHSLVITNSQEIEKLKGKDLANNEVTHHPSDPETNTELITPKLLNKRSAHSAYIKHTQEEAAVLRDLVDHIKANYPLDPTLESACKYTKLIQELLTKISKTCPSLNNSREQLVAVTTMNKKKVRFTKPVTSSRNTIPKRTSTSNLASNKPMLSSTGVKPSTSASRSQPSSNTKKDKNRILSSTQSTDNLYLEVRLGMLRYQGFTMWKDLDTTYSPLGSFCDSNIEVAFRQHTCFIRNLEGVDLLTGYRGNNLYTLSLGDMMASSPICLLSKASKTKSWLCHRCLSHLNFGAINHLARHGLV
ncbi:putative ribonuclease H-like domain-containing protein [Tanacetum coccineum]